MHDDPAHRWTLQKLAERVGMSRSIFALKFKQTVGYVRLTDGPGILRCPWQRLQFRLPSPEGKAYDLFLSLFTLVPTNAHLFSA